MERLRPIFTRLYETYPLYGPLVFVDFETTGLSRDAKVIEIGAISVSFDGIHVAFDTFETLINPNQKIDKIVTDTTGITNEELANAPGEEKYHDFHQWLLKSSPSKIIAHNANFDERIIKYNFNRMNIHYMFPSFECTVRMSRKQLKDISNDKLVTVANKFNFKNTQAHRALTDTETCAYVYAKLILGEYQ
mgnify:FL=1